MEEWRDIPGFEGWYQVSNHGRVKSLERTFVTSEGCARTYKSRVLKYRLGNHGYPTLHLRIKGVSSFACAHALVALAFLGPRPDGMEHIRHLDGDRENSRPENLKYGTAKENIADTYRHGRGNSGERNPKAKLTTAQVHEIRKAAADDKLLSDLYGVGPGCIYGIRTGRTWRHLT